MDLPEALLDRFLQQRLWILLGCLQCHPPHHPAHRRCRHSSPTLTVWLQSPHHLQSLRRNLSRHPTPHLHCSLSRLCCLLQTLKTTQDDSLFTTSLEWVLLRHPSSSGNLYRTALAISECGSRFRPAKWDHLWSAFRSNAILLGSTASSNKKGEL